MVVYSNTYLHTPSIAQLLSGASTSGQVTKLEVTHYPVFGLQKVSLWSCVVEERAIKTLHVFVCTAAILHHKERFVEVTRVYVAYVHALLHSSLKVRKNPASPVPEELWLVATNLLGTYHKYEIVLKVIPLLKVRSTL